MNWRLKEEGYDRERITKLGNKFLTGNGYMGIRGTLQEYEKEQYPAINLAGIYDQVGDAWREPLNAPNGLYTYIVYDDIPYRLPEKEAAEHHTELDYRYGIYTRVTSWNTDKGILRIRSERFASLEEKHLIVMKYEIYAEKEGRISLITGIDADVWDINGPHYDELQCSRKGDVIQVVGITHENRDEVYVSQCYSAEADVEEKLLQNDRKLLRHLEFRTEAGGVHTFYMWVSVYTSKDDKAGKDLADTAVRAAGRLGYDELVRKHKEEWERKWGISEVVIEGDPEAMEALNYSLYHLHCIAPRHKPGLSIAARGLSGQTYKGAVFWDTEMFMLDFFLFTEPEVARALLRYRIDTLDGARKKAGQYGYQGAFYAWESQEGGYDACSDYNVTDVFTGRQMRTYFKDKQIHISSAIVYGIMRYTAFTGSKDILREGGAKVILECAVFYYDLLWQKADGRRYELHDVIGPDEYHERVNNNAYTNRMAKFTFDSAVHILTTLSELGEKVRSQLSEIYDCDDLLRRFREASERIYIPRADTNTGIIEQFDGYGALEDISIEEVRSRLLHEKEYWGGAYGVASHTKVIKQADVITMLNLFSAEYEEDILRKNWEYYEPRTEHGSSLSACMYSMLACKCRMPDLAYPFFMKSALSDITQQGKEWAGLVYIGGTHPASSGGAYMTAIEGFAGIHEENGELKAVPNLPSKWEHMLFKIVYRDNIYQIEVGKTKAAITNLGAYDGN